MIKFTNEEFSVALKNSISWAEISRKLKVHHTGERIKGYKKLYEKLELSNNHLTNSRWPKDRSIPNDMIWGNRIPIEKILVKNSNYKGGSNHIKNRILKEKILENKCIKCGNNGIWQNKPITLQLDHIGNALCRWGFKARQPNTCRKVE